MILRTPYCEDSLSEHYRSDRHKTDTLRVFLKSMNCAEHPSRDAISTCADCGNGVCIECSTELENGTLCSSCVENRLTDNERSLLVKALIVVGLLLAGSLIISLMIG
jgi:hypothetical protein